MTATITVECLGPSGETTAVAYPVAGATGAVTSVSIEAQLTPVPDARKYTATLSWDDSIAANEPLGKWRIDIGGVVTQVEMTAAGNAEGYTLGTALGNVATVDDAAIANAVAARLATVDIQVVSAFDPETKTLTIVQRTDYVAESVNGPLRFSLQSFAAFGIADGDTIWLGISSTYAGSTQVSGLVVTIEGELFAEIELTHDHTDLNADVDWRWELEHVSSTGKRTALIQDSPVVVVASRAEPTP
ncbi:MAG: hypothetical protein AAGC97_03560 [Planctomycetota bacterium]